MTVSPVSPTGSVTSAATASDVAKATTDYNAFLQLLVTELKNQDPMKPLDPTQTVTQLATFSSVEQAVKTNALLSSLNANGSLSQGAALIGREAASADGATYGRISSITLSDTGLVATLDTGETLRMESGVSIG
jgi:flagellar basal-body rod modification protein FlgD